MEILLYFSLAWHELMIDGLAQPGKLKKVYFFLAELGSKAIGECRMPCGSLYLKSNGTLYFYRRKTAFGCPRGQF